MNMEEKRKKSTTFKPEEELRLLELIEKEKFIIENKSTNKVSNDEKDKAWQRIATAFNATALHWRSRDQLKSKYDNIKTKTRKVVAAQCSHIKGTGGGAPILDTFDPVIESTLKIVNLKTVLGFRPLLDSDHLEISTEPQPMQPTYATIEDVEVHNFPIISVIDESKLNESQIPHEIEVQANSDVGCSYLEESVPATPVKKTKSKWSKYTPLKLREPISRQLRPTVTNPLIEAKEIYYKKKTALVEAQIEAIKKETRRKEEEHSQLKILLDLQIREMERKLNNND